MVRVTGWQDGRVEREALISGGMTAKQSEALCHAGDLHILRRGRYLRSTSWTALDAQDRHRLRAGELGASLGGHAAVSHESAALLHGFELPPMTLARVHLTWAGSPGRRGTVNIHPHRGNLDDEDLATIGGTLMTGAARTIFDLARSAPAAVAISAADSALRIGRCSPHSLASGLARTTRVPGHHRAPKFIAFADSRAESVGESICRLRMAQLGIPDPNLQVVIPQLSHRFGVRVDFELPSCEQLWSSTDGSSTAACSSRARTLGTSCSRRSAARMRSAERAGRSSGSSGMSLIHNDSARFSCPGFDRRSPGRALRTGDLDQHDSRRRDSTRRTVPPTCMTHAALV